MSSSARRRPQGRRANITRSNSSFISTLSKIVSAPLNWFGGADDSGDNGKRKPLVQANPDTYMEDGEARTKRQRVHSPDRETALTVSHAYSAYLDPPPRVLQQQHAHNSNSSSAPPSTIHPLDFNNQSYGISSLGRTMSIDPPQFKQGLVRDTSMADITSRETPMVQSRSNSASFSAVPQPLGPRASFRMRTSMTPQPSNSAFGPTVQRRPQDPSEPPPLTALMSNPIFVRAPPPNEQRRTISGESVPTLGSLVESQRSTRSPVRQHSAIAFGPQSTHKSDSPAGSVRTINAAEKALHELDVYKTPLLPTRMRGSAGIPEMFKQPKARSFIPMQQKDDRERLGKKGKRKDTINDTKPYAGEGGMKKLLARRKMEEDSEKTEQDREDSKRRKAAKRAERRASAENKVEKEVLVQPPPSTFANLPESVFDPSGNNRDQSSLRVGRTRERNHIARPQRQSHKQARFSAASDDEDDEEKAKELLILHEAAKNAPVFNIPSSFTFPTTTPPAQQHDSTDFQEPPTTSLPFSFAAPAQLASNEESSSTAGTESTDSVPSFFGNGNRVSAFAAPAAPVRQAEPAPAVPNFFAQVPPSPKITETATPAAKDDENPFMEAPVEPAEKTNEGTFSGQASAPASTSLFGAVPSVPTTSGPSLSGAAPTVPTANSSSLSTSESSAEKTAASTLASGFTFGASKAAEVAKTNSSFLGTSFSFGITPSPKPEVVPSPESNTAAPTAKSALFGPAASAVNQSAPTANGFSFNPPALSTVGEPSKPPGLFTFGASAATSDVESPRPLFARESSFSSTQPSAATLASEAPSKAAFPTGLSTPPAVESKSSPFAFGTAAAPTSFSFGNSNGTNTSSTAPASSPFTFGAPAAAAATARPITPPQEQEFRMEESPTRELQPPAESRPASSGFSFGSGNNTGGMFGQQSASTPSTNSSPFAFGAPSSSSTNPFGAPIAVETKPAEKPSVGFSFGQTAQAPASNSGFTFGGSSNEPAASRPSSSSSFSFPSAGNNAPSTSFAFGGASNNTPSNVNTSSPFGAPSQPSSPSTFGQTQTQSSPFAFSAPAAPAANPFAFGSSQPASPAAANSTLQPSGGFTFGGGNTGASGPNTGFGSSVSATPPGGSLFTMGSAAPSPATGPASARQLRKLPNRRATAKR